MAGRALPPKWRAKTGSRVRDLAAFSVNAVERVEKSKRDILPNLAAEPCAPGISNLRRARLHCRKLPQTMAQRAARPSSYGRPESPTPYLFRDLCDFRPLRAKCFLHTHAGEDDEPNIRATSPSVCIASSDISAGTSAKGSDATDFCFTVVDFGSPFTSVVTAARVAGWIDPGRVENRFDKRLICARRIKLTVPNTGATCRRFPVAVSRAWAVLSAVSRCSFTIERK